MCCISIVDAPSRKRRGTEKGDCPGSIAVMGGPCADDDKEKRGVINVFGQFCPGKPNRKRGPVEWKGIVGSKDIVDDGKQRLQWFKSGLQQIATLELESIAFPHQIGCGLAGGDWKDYLAALEEFAELVKDRNVKALGPGFGKFGYFRISWDHEMIFTSFSLVLEWLSVRLATFPGEALQDAGSSQTLHRLQEVRWTRGRSGMEILLVLYVLLQPVLMSQPNALRCTSLKKRWRDLQKAVSHHLDNLLRSALDLLQSHRLMTIKIASKNSSFASKKIDNSQL